MKLKAWLLLAFLGALLSAIVAGVMFSFGWLNDEQAIMLFILGTIAIPVSERFYPIVLKRK